MSSWQVSGQGGAVMPLPFGLRIAGMGSRLGAWILDLALFALLSLVPLAFAVASGGVGLNSEALRQTEANPYLQPTVPWLVVNTVPLIFWAAVWVVFAIVYATVCWAFFRGLPAQRLLALQVADAATGKNLSLPRATWRAVLVNGIPAAAGAVTIVAVCEMLATIIPADLGSSGDPASLYAGASGSWSTFFSLFGLASWAWPMVLLISTAAVRDKRGMHDRLAGSVVVGRALAPVAWNYPYAPAPGHAPGPGYAPRPGYAPGPWYPYGPQPAVPGQPAAEPAAAPQSEDVGSGDAAGTMPAEQWRPPTWPGLVEPEQIPAPGGQPRPSVDPQPDSRVTLGVGPQVFGAKLPAGLRVAGINRRTAAYGLDCVIVLMLFGVIETLVVGPQQPNAGLPPERLAMLAGLASGLAQAVYFVATWSIWRGSIGQKALRLQVGDESTGHRLSLADSIVRWALLQGPFALFSAVPVVLQPVAGIAAIGWLWLLTYSTRTDPDRRGYHDRLAHSLVVEQG